MRFIAYFSILFILASATRLKLSPLRPTDISVVHLDCPTYGQAARQSRTQGDVRVEVDIDRSGDVTAVRGITGNALLIHDAALNAQSWRFNSGEQRKIELAYEFRLVEPEIYCPVPSRVTFDFPYHVRVVSNLPEAMPNR